MRPEITDQSDANAANTPDAGLSISAPRRTVASSGAGNVYRTSKGPGSFDSKRWNAATRPCVTGSFPTAKAGILPAGEAGITAGREVGRKRTAAAAATSASSESEAVHFRIPVTQAWTPTDAFSSIASCGKKCHAVEGRSICGIVDHREHSTVVSENRHLHLSQLRDALLELHKTLVDSERAGYEQTFGTITSPNHLLRLLTDDPWFAWLHPLSLLIVSMDEALDEKEPLSADGAANLLGQTRRLLVAAEDQEGFPRNYFDALQRDPDVVFAHAKAASFFRPQKPAS